MTNLSTADTSQTTSSSGTLLARLSAMMFLQYWPLGTWGVTFGSYIAANTDPRGAHFFSSGFVGYSTTAGAIGSLLSPLLIGFLSDRYVNAERLVTLMHAGCALAAWQMSQTQSQTAFYLWLLLYYQCFSPSCALTNKIALRHLADSRAEYPVVRLFGTIGWIAAGIFVGLLWPTFAGDSIEMTASPLLIGAVGNVVMIFYSLSLPRTPTELKSGRVIPSMSRDGKALLCNGQLMLFLGFVLFACLPSMAYNNYGNVYLNEQHFWHPAALMTVGQVSETLMLAASPWLIPRFGLNKLFATGLVAWCVRYLLLAFASYTNTTGPVYGAIAIHGVCYVFVYVVGVMYVDRLVTHSHRGLAQGMYTLVYAGLANLLGGITVGYCESLFLNPKGIDDWTIFWLIPGAISTVTAIAFITTSWRRRTRTT